MAKSGLRCSCLRLVASGCVWLRLVASECFWIGSRWLCDGREMAARFAVLNSHSEWQWRRLPYDCRSGVALKDADKGKAAKEFRTSSQCVLPRTAGRPSTAMDGQWRRLMAGADFHRLTRLPLGDLLRIASDCFGLTSIGSHDCRWEICC